MKKIFLILIITTASFNIFAKDFLSRSNKTVILNKLNQRCLDTLCEGLYKYTFYQINCNQGSGDCSLMFKYYSYRDKNNIKKSTCALSNLYETKDLINSSRELNQDFYYQWSTSCYI